MNKTRLLKLADFLETVPRKAFNLETWQKRGATKPEGKRQGDCGFAGCAIGWAAHAKLFPGFRLGRYKYDHEAFVPYYKGLYGFEAINALFGTVNGRTHDGDGSYSLFVDTAYDGASTPKQVAKRIRKFVKDNSEASHV